MELLHSIWSTPNSNIPLVDSICPPILVGWCDQAIRATYEPYWSRFELILFWSKVWLKYLNQMIRIFKSNDWEKLIQKTNDVFPPPLSKSRTRSKVHKVQKEGSKYEAWFFFSFPNEFNQVGSEVWKVCHLQTGGFHIICITIYKLLKLISINNKWGGPYMQRLLNEHQKKKRYICKQISDF